MSLMRHFHFVRAMKKKPVPTAIPAVMPQLRSALWRASYPRIELVNMFWVDVAVADISVMHPNRMNI